MVTHSFGPVSDPRLIVAVMIDEPQGVKYFGGDVGGPVFSSVMGNALRLLSVTDDSTSRRVGRPLHGEIRPTSCRLGVKSRLPQVGTKDLWLILDSGMSGGAGNRLDVHAYRCVGVAARNRQNNCVHRSLFRPVVTRRAV